MPLTIGLMKKHHFQKFTKSLELKEKKINSIRGDGDYMNPEYDINYEETKNLSEKCLENAENSLKAAKLLLIEDTLNFSYHLAALSMEEIGKCLMIKIGMILPGTDEKKVLSKGLDDHVKKLFFALWMAGNSITAQFNISSIRTNQQLARHIHETRLNSLYVNSAFPDTPIKQISKEEVKSLIDLVEARLRIEEISTLKLLEKKERDNLVWFLGIQNEDELKWKWIWSQSSLSKWEEIKDAHKWFEWLRCQFEGWDKQSEEHLNFEINRDLSSFEAQEIKWKFKVSLFTNSHSIRQKQLTWFNKISDNTKVHSPRKNELLIEFSLPKKISPDKFWMAAWSLSRRFVIALNIASKGFFWWQLPKDTSKFYESIKDIENNCMVKIERSPILQIDWGKTNVLSENDLGNTAMVFSLMPQIDDEKGIEVFNHYAIGLALLAKNDIHLQFEASIFQNFYRSLKEGMQFYGDFTSQSNIVRDLKNILDPFIPSFDDYDRYIYLGESVLHGAEANSITLEEVGVMKVICDLYFLLTLNKVAELRRKQNISD